MEDNVYFIWHIVALCVWVLDASWKGILWKRGCNGILNHLCLFLIVLYLNLNFLLSVMRIIATFRVYCI